MIPESVRRALARELKAIHDAHLAKDERVLVSPQGAAIRVRDGREVLNFCANNYLGLANHPRLVQAARDAMEKYGYGLSSVRFICGTQEAHKELERDLAAFFGFDDAILYISCWDANGGLFETLLGPDDAVVSDSLNHASIIDGIRLCKAARYRYRNCDLDDLEAKLREARSNGAERVMIATDGVFSMDATIAPLQGICDLAERHDAMVMVDDSHATGVIGATGRGSVEHCGVQGRVDVVNGTLGKALGGGAGGFTAASADIVELLRNRARPYLFSNTMPPALVGAARAALRLLNESPDLLARLRDNTKRFREAMTAAGFQIPPGETPIVPIMVHEARVATRMAEALLDEGVYVIGFSYPVVPKGQARIRVQLSAAHTPEQVERAIAAFVQVGRRQEVIPEEGASTGEEI